MTSALSAPATNWPSQDEAAEQLGTSVRTIRRMLAERKLSSRLQPVAGRKPVVLIDPADIDRILGERQRPVVLPPEPEPTALSLTRSATKPAMEIAQAPSRQAREAFLLATFPPPFLSVPEAARYSGLPGRLISRLIREGRLPALGHAGEFYIKRRDLDDLAMVSDASGRGTVAGR